MFKDMALLLQRLKAMIEEIIFIERFLREPHIKMSIHIVEYALLVG